MPVRIAKRHVRAGQVSELMAVGALERRKSLALATALDAFAVRMTVVAMSRHVAQRMAIHARRVQEDRIGRQKRGAGVSILPLRSHSGMSAHRGAPLDPTSWSDKDQSSEARGDSSDTRGCAPMAE